MQKTFTASTYPVEPNGVAESYQSAVSWGAVIAGAVIAAAMSAVLITGGAGLGFLAVSPWRNDGAPGDSIAIGTIIWLFVTQIIAYGIAGYVAGRLRTKWAAVHADEVYFRDTAHGFLVWALSAVIGVFLLGSAASSVISGTAQVGATLVGSGAGAVTAVAGSAAAGNQQKGSLDYFTDALLRPADASMATDPEASRQEVTRILAHSAIDGKMSEPDQSYLVQVIAHRAGITEAQAKDRLSTITEQAKQMAADAEQKAREAADSARKAAALFALWAFASLLMGAFVASFSATMGGRARDA